MLGGQVLAAAGTDEFETGVVAQRLGWERHRCADRLEAAQWQRNDQALDLALKAKFEVMRDHIDMPVRQVALAAIDRLKGLGNES